MDENQIEENLVEEVPSNYLSRIELLDKIADSADEITADQFVPNDINPENATEEQVDNHKDQEEPAEVVKTFKLKINGVEKEATEQEVLAAAQKVLSADQYLHEASKIYREASVQPSKDVSTDVDDDDIALARAIQMGTEDEAAKAIQTVRAKARLSQDDVVKLVNSSIEERMKAQTDLSRFFEEYKDLLADPIAKDLVYELDENYHLRGEQPGYERFKKAAERVKQIRGTTHSMDDKRIRKASVTPITVASSRAPAEVEESEPTPSEVIAQMAGSRKGRLIGA